ncbi:hypothetical protein CRUP_000444 [Coryphaenoides rupestris]|nr:hypothetical protein CRUP_000444 [Coryphaenoides rupestris]
MLIKSGTGHRLEALNYAESRLTQLEGCHCERMCSTNGLLYRDKELWVEPENCRNCACKNGVVECRRIFCPPANCSKDALPVHVNGTCCKKCRREYGTPPRWARTDGRAAVRAGGRAGGPTDVTRVNAQMLAKWKWNGSPPPPACEHQRSGTEEKPVLPLCCYFCCSVPHPREQQQQQQGSSSRGRPLPKCTYMGPELLQKDNGLPVQELQGMQGYLLQAELQKPTLLSADV